MVSKYSRNYIEWKKTNRISEWILSSKKGNGTGKENGPPFQLMVVKSMYKFLYKVTEPYTKENKSKLTKQKLITTTRSNKYRQL